MWQTKVNLVDLCCIVCFWKLKSFNLNELVNREDFLWFKGPFGTLGKPVHHAYHWLSKLYVNIVGPGPR